MSLFDVKTGTKCVIKNIDILDEKIKIRLMELGLIKGTKILVKNKSVFKKTLLIIFNNSCFSIGEKMAKNIVVEYA